MQEHRAAAAGDARPRVVIDFDNEIVEMILAREAVAVLVQGEPQRPIVMTVDILAPGVLGGWRVSGATSMVSDGGRRATTAAGETCPVA